MAAGVMLATAAALLGVTLYLYKAASGREHVVINEACSSNFTVICDENGNYSDYVELYNPLSEPVCLTGWYLSDDNKEPCKHALEGITVPAGGYALIWLDGSEAGDAYHASFRLSRSGEAIYLADDSGRVIDSVMVPSLSYNTSYARREDGAKEWGIMEATAGSSNDGAQSLKAVELAEPEFSVESGFYGEPFLVSIKAPAGTVVYYTLDGSDPDTDSSVYSQPLAVGDASQQENVYAARTDLSPTNGYTPSFKVDKATVVRAIAYDPEKDTVSDIVTKSYFVNFGQKSEYENYPVISLVTDPDNLFDADTGIYTTGAALEKYREKGGLADGELLDNFVSPGGGHYYLYEASNAFHSGKEWEREAVITYFDGAHSYCFTQNAGIRISGQSTRGAIQKSFNVFGREIYDDNRVFPYQIFPGMSYSTFKLRNGGSDNARSKIMDAFLQSLAVGRAVSVQQTVPCVVFLNGEYWGVYNIRERYKEEYVSNHFGVAQDNVWIIDSGSAGVGGQAAQDAYQQMLDFVSQCDMSNGDNYAAACSLLDVQSLIDFYCINLYIDNTDVGFGQNMALWRSAKQEENAFADCRWRWMIFDVDCSLNSWDSNTFVTSEDWMEDFDLMDEALMKGLMQNEQFRKQFCLTFMDIANTSFAYERVHESLMEWKEKYQVQVVKSHQRFFRADYGPEDFDACMEDFDTFFQKRFPFITECLAQELGLSGCMADVTIRIHAPEGGSVMVNTAVIGGADAWTGQYFTDYPITVCALPTEGYRFVGWSGDLEGQEAQLLVEIPENGITLTAVFEKEE